MITLAKSGASPYSIVVSTAAIPSERFAAEELSHTLSEITGAYFAIIHPDMAKGIPGPRIYIGHGEETLALGVEPDASLGGEGYQVQTVGEDIVIAGGRPRGTLYGVYALLEEVLGCRWYTPTAKHIPRRETLTLPELSLRYRPILEYREPYYGAAFDGDWCARNRANGHFDRLYDKHGFRVKYYKYFVHTFDHLVPVETYFESHPEYFSLVDGERIRDQTQLCLTNPDVLRLVIDGVRGWIADDPEATVFSVSQNDWYNPCQCENCRRIDEEEGGHAGTLIRFVNQVAQAIEAEAPHVVIDTLAYQYTRPAPKKVRPRPNVCVRLCSIESCFSHPLDKCDVVVPPFTGKVDKEASFQKDLRDWARICDRIYIWDYVTNFSHYCMPFPNLDVIQPNIQFLVENSVKGIFEQGNYSAGGGPDFNELRTYLLAKLLWDPYTDIQRHTWDFMNGYYGKAAPALMDYIRELHRKIRDEDIHFGIFTVHSVAYLDEAMLAYAEDCFRRAEALADDDTVLYRVRRAYMSIRYVRLANQVEAGTATEEMIDAYLMDMPRYGMTRVSEWRSLSEDKALMMEGKLRVW